jgi:hypothetical protein
MSGYWDKSSSRTADEGMKDWRLRVAKQYVIDSEKKLDNGIG